MSAQTRYEVLTPTPGEAVPQSAGAGPLEGIEPEPQREPGALSTDGEEL